MTDAEMNVPRIGKPHDFNGMRDMCPGDRLEPAGFELAYHDKTGEHFQRPLFRAYSVVKDEWFGPHSKKICEHWLWTIHTTHARRLARQQLAA